jgi:hypothetical protein
MKPTLERRPKLPTLKPMGDLIWCKCIFPATICLFHDGLQRACHAKAVFYSTYKPINLPSAQRKKRCIQGCVLLCENRTCRRGGVCSKHWSTLFKKQLLPVLIRPEPTFSPLGQDVSMGLEKRVAPFFPVGEDCGVGMGSLWATRGFWAGTCP